MLCVNHASGGLYVDVFIAQMLMLISYLSAFVNMLRGPDGVKLNSIPMRPIPYRIMPRMRGRGLTPSS